MKVMISGDMEGISGVVEFDHIHPAKPAYQRARRWYTHDVNAAVQGCVDGGAEQVVVLDGHAQTLNILYEDIHPEAQLIQAARSSHRPGLGADTIDETYDLVLFVGYHAAAHHAAGLLSHTAMLPGAFYEVRVNGEAVGESEISAALAGSYGVPVGMISSDDVTVEQVKGVLPQVEGVVTKYAIDRTGARCLSLQKTERLIREGAQRAVERARAGELKPWTIAGPYTLEIDCGHTGMAHKLGGIPGARRSGPRTVALEAPTFPELCAGFVVLCYTAGTTLDP